MREWLGAMVDRRACVDVDPDSQRFRLPAEHAAFLTRAAGADNLAVVHPVHPVLGMVEDDIVECFREGGGVPYERFPRFHEVMAEDSGQSVLVVARVAHPSARARDWPTGWRAASPCSTLGCGRGRT